MKHTYITRRCNAIDAFHDIYNDALKRLKADYNYLSDFYDLFRSTTSTYALRYKFTSKINSVKKLLGALNSTGVELKGRDLLIHITYPEGASSEVILESIEAIQSSYQTPDKEIVCVPTIKPGIKFWQVKVYLFDEYLDERYWRLV